MDVPQLQRARKALLMALAYMNEYSSLATVALSACAVAAEVLKHFRVPFEPAAGYLVLKGDTRAVPHAWLVTRDMPKGDGTTVPFAVTDLSFVSKYRAVTILGQNIYFDDTAVLGTYYPGTELPPGCSLVVVPPDKPQPLSVLQLLVEVGDLTRYLNRPEARAVQEKVRFVVDKALQPPAPPPSSSADASGAGAQEQAPHQDTQSSASGPYVAFTEEDPLARKPT